MAGIIQPYFIGVNPYFRKDGDDVLLRDPLNPMEAATKQYVDRVAAPIDLPIVSRPMASFTSNPGSTNTSAINCVGLNINSVATTAINDATGHYINYRSNTTLSAPVGWIAGGVTNFSTALNGLPDFISTMKTGALATDIQSVRLWFVLVGGAGAITGDDLVAAGGGVGFRYSAPAGDVNWKCVSADSTNANTVDSGVAVVVDTRYTFRVKATAASSVDYYINNVLVATIGTNLPAADKVLVVEAHGVNAVAGTGRNLRLRQCIVYTT